MPLGKFRAAQSAGQLALFVGGLLWALLCWRSAERSSFGITLGLALALAGVVWLGLSARTLHWVLIGTVPIVGVAVLAWLAWGGSGLGVRWLGVVGSGFLLSLTIETGQIWLPERVSSLNDLACNGLGALLGGGFGALAGRLAALRR